MTSQEYMFLSFQMWLKFSTAVQIDGGTVPGLDVFTSRWIWSITKMRARERERQKIYLSLIVGSPCQRILVVGLSMDQQNGWNRLATTKPKNAISNHEKYLDFDYLVPTSSANDSKA